MSKAQVIAESNLQDEENGDAFDVNATLSAVGGTASGDYYANFQNGSSILLDHKTIPPSNGDNDDVFWSFEVDSDGNGSNDTETSLGGSGTIGIYGGMLTLSYNSETGAWSVLGNGTWAPGTFSGGPISTSITVRAYGIDGGDTNPFADTSSINLTVTCFASGTLIACPDGETPIEQLSEGDLVETAGGAVQQVRWVARIYLDADDLQAMPNMRPVRIARDSFGKGRPHRNLVVSPQHRILVRSSIAHRMFGHHEVLVPAKKLVGYPGIRRDETSASVEYIHLLLESHELLTANGLVSESLYWGEEVNKAFWHSTCNEGGSGEKAHLRPGSKMEPVRHCVSNNRQIADLISHHASHGIDLIQELQPA